MAIPLSKFPNDSLQTLLYQQIDDLHECELLTLLLWNHDGSGTIHLEHAQKLWSHFHSLVDIERAGIAEIQNATGLSERKAIAIHAALELGRRLVVQPLKRGQSYTNSKEVFESYGPRLSKYEQETFWILLLDQCNRFLKQIHILTGSMNMCHLSVQDVFAPALRERAAKMILIHNHPSGDPDPSSEDRKLTASLQKIGNFLDIQIVDHIVLGHQGYVSFADQGWI